MGVPLERAQWAAAKYGDDGAISQPDDKARKMIAREGRRKAADLERRKFRVWCKGNGLPLPVAEFKFCESRNWRADWAWPNPDGGGILLEIDGGGHVRGRHHRAEGFQHDQEKRNAAIGLGFRPLHVTPQTLFTQDTLDMLRPLLCVLTELNGNVP
jgi:hypothetical protein